MNKTKHQYQYIFENIKLFHFICGASDQNILEIEKLLEIEIIPRGNSFIIRSEEVEKINHAVEFFNHITNFYKNREIEAFDLKYLVKIFNQNQNLDTIDNFSNYEFKNFVEQEKLFVTHRGKPIFAKTLNQYQYIKSLFQNPITIATGPAGTGKTFLAVVVASKLLLKGDIERIIITRPAVEAGESLGFLPGDMVQKVDPYLRPIYDSLYEILGVEKTNQLIQFNKIEVAPLAFMRGRTLNDAMMILDEAQNCTLLQLKMFLTRIGKNTRICISGDVTQTDLKPGQSGLYKLTKIVNNIKEIQIMNFTKDDIVRNPIVEKIIHAFEEYEKNKQS